VEGESSCRLGTGIYASLHELSPARLRWRRRGREVRPHCRTDAGHLPRVGAVVVKQTGRPQQRERRRCRAAKPTTVHLAGAAEGTRHRKAEAEVKPAAPFQQRRRAEREQRAEESLRRRGGRRRGAAKTDVVASRRRHGVVCQRARALACGPADGDVAEGPAQRPVAAAGATEVAWLRRVVVVVVAELGVVRRAPRALLAPRAAAAAAVVVVVRLGLRLLQLLEVRHLRRRRGGGVAAAGAGHRRRHDVIALPGGLQLPQQHGGLLLLQWSLFHHLACHCFSCAVVLPASGFRPNERVWYI
jgi:hypothetical protein